MIADWCVLFWVCCTKFKLTHVVPKLSGIHITSWCLLFEFIKRPSQQPMFHIVSPMWQIQGLGCMWPQLPVLQNLIWSKVTWGSTKLTKHMVTWVTRIPWSHAVSRHVSQMWVYFWRKQWGLGADEVINYRTTKFEEVVKDYDAVLDTVTQEHHM